MNLSVLNLEIPPDPGAYAVVLSLKAPLLLRIKRFAGVTLDAGLYLYSGSANGPGGMRARLSRHLRGKKKIHWHIDHLTAKADILGVAALPKGKECRIVRKVLMLKNAAAPLPGFGSSDCSTCPSHLIHLPAKTDTEDLFKMLNAKHYWLSD